MALVTDANIVKSLDGASSQRLYKKASATTEGVGTYHSFWKVAGLPAAGANPPLFSAGSGYVPTKATAGAYAFANAATNGHVAALKASLLVTTAMTAIWYDRIWACSGFGTVVTTAQTVITPGALPTGRDPNNGADVEPWIEIYTAPGATAATWTLTGTDAAGNTGRTWTYAHPANAETVGQMAPFMPGTAATLGIRQVDSLTCSISSGTAGDVGVTLLRRIASIGAVAYVEAFKDAIQLGLPPVFNDDCIAMMTLNSASPTGIVDGEFVVGEGL